MKLNPLSGTDLKLSEISFGCGTAAGLFVGGSRAQQLDAFARAREAGVNHFDTAPVYGYGCSEVNLGAILKETKADVVLTTKFNVSPAQLAHGNIGHAIRQSLAGSLVRLQRDHVDILLMHNATHFQRNIRQPDANNPLGDLIPHLTVDDLLGPGGVVETVTDLKKRGLIRYFGISGQDNNPDALRRAIDAGAVSIFNQPFNILNPSAGFPAARSNRKLPTKFTSELAGYLDFDDVVEHGRLHGVGASVISPVAAGAFTEDAIAGIPAPDIADRARRFPREGQYEREINIARRFVPVAKKFGMSVTALAYRFALGCPGVVTVVGGFSNTRQMLQAVEAANMGHLEPEAIKAIEAIWFGQEA